jgi:hypothetical protein
VSLRKVAKKPAKTKMHALSHPSALLACQIRNSLQRRHTQQVLSRAGARPRPTTGNNGRPRSLRPFFDKVVKNSNATFGPSDAQTFMRALLEFDDPQELLYRLTNRQVLDP